MALEKLAFLASRAVKIGSASGVVCRTPLLLFELPDEQQHLKSDR